MMCQRVGSQHFFFRFSLEHEGFDLCLGVDQHVDGCLQVGTARQRPVARNDNRVFFGHLDDAALAVNETADASAAVQVDEREHVVEEQVAGNDDVGTVQEDNGIAIGVRLGDMTHVCVLAVDVKVHAIRESNDGEAALTTR